MRKKKRRKPLKMYMHGMEVAEILGVTFQTVHNWARSGFLPGYRYQSRPGSRAVWRFSREAVLRFQQAAYMGQPRAEQPRAEQPSQ